MVYVHPEGDSKEHFDQFPSQHDIDVAQPSPIINMVVGAYSRRAYFYDKQGNIGDVKLKEIAP